jgi:hypothetical protein
MHNQMVIDTGRPGTGSHRRTAKIVGVIYLAGMVIGIFGNILILSILSAPDRMASISQNSMLLGIAAMLWLLTVAGDAAHGILMFPILREHSERMAVGYLGFRIIDATFIAIMVMVILAQVPIADTNSLAGTSDGSLLSLSTVLIQTQLYAYSIAMFTLGVAGLIVCWVFYKANLLPQPLAIWGLAGYSIILCGSVLEILGFDLMSMHAVPGGLWEVFIGVWLIAKGFKRLTGRSGSPDVTRTPTPTPRPTVN